MQKYKLWIVIALIVLCLITLILWLAPRDEAQARVSGPQSTNESSAQQAAALANGPVNIYSRVQASRIRKLIARCRWMPAIA